MPYRNALRFAMPLLVGCSLIPCAAAAWPQDAQTQDNQSVAEAARRAREQKKTAKSAAKVISDDDLSTNNAKPGAEGLNVGSAPKSDVTPPTPAAVNAAEATEKAATPTAKELEKKGENPEIAELKAQLAKLQRELDFQQRELSLDQDTYYSNPAYSDDKAGKDKLDAEKRQISGKQQQIDEVKTRLGALKELEEKKKAEAAVNPPANTEKPTESPTPAPSQP